MTDWPVHARFDGPIVMIGFGSIGRGTLPLIERHIAHDRTKFTVIAPDDADRHLLDERGIRFEQLAITRDNYRDVLTPAADGRRRAGPRRQPVGRHVLGGAHRPLQGHRRALHRHRRRALAGLLHRHAPQRLAALQLRPARDADGPAPRAARAARPRSPPAAPTPAWCPGSSSRRCSTSPRRSAMRRPSPRRARAGPGWPRRSASRASTSPSATRSAPRRPSPWAPSSTPGRSRASCPRACSRPNSAGARTRRRCPREGRHHDFGPDCAIYLMRPGAGTRVRSWTPTRRPAARLPRHPQRVDLDRRLPDRERGRRRPSTGRPATTPTTRPTTRCCRCTRWPGNAWQRQPRLAHPQRGRDRRRHRRTRRAALRPRQERLLVRLAALHRGDAPHRALPERHGPAGDLGGAGRHRLGAREPEGRHRRGRRDGLPPLPRGADALSRPGGRRLHGLDARRGPRRPVPRGHRHATTRGSSRNVIVR